jgi:hypothetical protein
VWRENGALIVFGILIVAAIAACFLFVYWQVDVSQHQWCDVLNTLTSVPQTPPANPTSNPSRVSAYQLYEEFMRLKGQFRCG